MALTKECQRNVRYGMFDVAEFHLDDSATYEERRVIEALSTAYGNIDVHGLSRLDVEGPHGSIVYYVIDQLLAGSEEA